MQYLNSIVFMTIILGTGTVVSLPVAYSLIHKGRLAEYTHRQLMGVGSLAGIILLFELFISDTPPTLLLSFIVWQAVNASLLLYSWGSEKITPVLYLTGTLLGLIVLWRLMAFLIPVKYPGLAYGTVLVGSFTIACGWIGTILSRKLKVAMNLRKSLKVVYWTLFVAIIIKITWITVSILVFQAEDVTGNVQLFLYLWSYSPVSFVAGVVLAGVLPAILSVAILSQKFLKNLKRLATATAVSLIVGEFFLKHLAVQYGFSF